MTDAVRATLHEPSGGSGADDLPGLHAREIDRLVAYLFSSDRASGVVEAESIAEEAFLELRATWPATGGYPSHQVHLFATAQSIASTWPRRTNPDAPDPLKDSALDFWDRADVTRLTVLQDSLDRLPEVPRRTVLLREMCGFDPAESAQILSVPESAVDNARGDALRALVPMIESGTSTGQARRGPLVPEDFGALCRVLQVSDGRVAAARSRFAATLAQGVPSGRPGASPSSSGTGRPTAKPGSTSGTGRPTAKPGSTPRPPAVAPSSPPTAAFSAGALSAANPEITRASPAAPPPAQPAPPPLSGPTARRPVVPQPNAAGQLGPQAYTGPAPSPGAPLAPPPTSPSPQTYAPPPQAYAAPPQTYVPPPQAYAAPPQTYVPPPQTYAAPPQTYAAPPPTYAPPPQTYAAPPPTYAPPPQTYAPPYATPAATSSSPLSAMPLSSLLESGSPLPPSGSLVDVGTPIFDSVSAWFSSGGASAWSSLDDAAWLEASRRAAAAPTVEGSTEVGLPRRRPGANTVPSAPEVMPRTSMFGPPSEQLDAGTVRSRLGGFQDGLRNARRLRDEVGEPIAAEVEANLFGGPMRSTEPPGPQQVPVPHVAPMQGVPTPVPPMQAVPTPVPPMQAVPTPVPPMQAVPTPVPPMQQGLPSHSLMPTRTPGAATGSQAGPVVGSPAQSGEGSDGRPSETRGFSAFYRDYLPQLLALLMVEGARPALAAEIAQDVMSAAYREWARIDKPRDWTRDRALAVWADRRADDDGPQRS